MKIFEFILLVISTVFPLYISVKKYSLRKEIALAIIGILVALHLIFGSYRWQMIPTYLLIIILAWCLLKEYHFFNGSWVRKMISGIVFIILILICWTLPHVLPVFNLPKPSGEYSVGSQYIHLKTDQEEVITSKKGDKRELMVKVWYPATVKQEKIESYLNKGERMGFAVKYGLPKNTFNYLDKIQTHTYLSPSVAKGKFPVLIFSHGHYSIASGYYTLMEEIVSHGYIVININHTYESTGSIFPDGEVKLYDTEYDRKHNNREMAKMIWDAMKNYKNSKTADEQFIAVENLIRNYFATEVTNRWSKDISLVINELEKWNSSTFLAQHLDLTKIGVFGHSQGGAAAGQALIDDNRIKAGINLDGTQWGKIIDTTMTKPFALVSSDWDLNHPNFNKHAYHNGSYSDFYTAKILNSGHSNFMDIPLMVNFSYINEAGSINPTKGFKITTEIVLRFFDKYLRNKPSNLLDLKTTYPELEIESRKKSD